jgi:hypothetical protein
MIAQTVIGICGVASVWLSQSPDVRRQKYACIYGMAAQPFWFYATWQAQQWGIFILCFFYAAAWMRGLWNHWLEPAFNAWWES